MEGAYCFGKINVPAVYLDKVLFIGCFRSFLCEPHFFVYYKDRPRQMIFVSKQEIDRKIRQEEKNRKHTMSQEELESWKIFNLKECRLWLCQNLKRKRQIRRKFFKKE